MKIYIKALLYGLLLGIILPYNMIFVSWQYWLALIGGMIIINL